MSRQVCRDFQRGSCRFGSRCKFLHDTSQQQPSNPFGFGLKNQSIQQPARGGNYYGALSSPQRPQRNQPQTQVKEHRCSDPRECKLQIKEDFENERPVYWRLTSYAHGKYLPNDVVGDISFEELRAYAYDAWKQGMPLQSVVQNEKNMIDVKNKEFESLLKNPYAGPASSFSSLLATAPSGTANVTFGTAAPFATPPSSTRPFGAAAPFGIAQSDASKMTFGTSSPFGASGYSSGPSQDSSLSRGSIGGGFSFGLGQSSSSRSPIPTPTPTPTPAPAPAPSPFTTQKTPEAGFSFGLQPFGSGLSSQMSSPQNTAQSSLVSFTGFGQSNFEMANSFNSFSPGASQIFSGNKEPLGPQKPNDFLQNSLSLQSVSSSTVSTTNSEISMQLNKGMITEHDLPTEGKDIWLKASWKMGEIPEEEPPTIAR